MAEERNNQPGDDAADPTAKQGTAFDLGTSRTRGEDAFDLATQVAPSFPGVFRTTAAATHSPGKSSPPLDAPPDGDFEVLRELGRGASGVVYLARQRSLGRVVALKVTHNVGAEARTMATLEHRHIVQVFSETVSSDDKLRLICMQFVDGITLATLISRLRVLAATATPELAFDLQDVAAGEFVPQSIADAVSSEPHSLLSNPQFVRSACRLMAQVADALAHAHRLGVLHRDIKPANILLDHDAQPLLADFSIAHHEDSADESGRIFGGTLAYMAPEHVDAFDLKTAETRAAVDERSDIYSLGLVLYELLTLEHPATPDTSRLSPPEFLRELAAQRRRDVPHIAPRATDVAAALNWTLAKCLGPEPRERFDDARELAAALRGCEQLSTCQAQLPPAGGFTRWLRAAPMFAPCLLSTGANLLAIAVGVLYTFSTPRGVWPGDAAWWLLGWWAVHVAVGASAMVALAVTNIRRVLPLLNGTADVAFDAEGARARAVRIPLLVALADLAFWLPNYIVVPLVIWRRAPSAAAFIDFFGMYTVIMLIAVTITYFFSEYAALRTYYPYAWTDTRHMSAVAARELRHVPQRLRPFQWLAAIVPVSAAVAIVMIGPDQFAPAGYFTFRVLAVALIVGGLLGLLATGAVRSVVEQTVRLFTGRAI